jgi:sugar-specific transcriptional regulator TrmB
MTEAARTILQLLPSTADQLRHLLGLTHEQVYAALVRLHDMGCARVSPGECRVGPRTWEAL